MKRHLLSLFLFFSGYAVVSAQNAAGYNFSVQSGVAMEDISSGATLIFANGQDDISSAPISLPFTFNFAGTGYNQFSVSSNGLIGFGPVAVTANGEDNLLDQSETYPVLAPWWEDLYTAANGSVTYKIMGTTGDRKLVVQWNVRKYKANGNLLYDKTFQAWLFEGTNKLQFVYGTGVVDAFTTASIGIANSGTDYLVVNSTDNTTSSTSADNTDAWPGNETSYVFSPSAVITEPITIAANGAVTSVSCNGGSNGVITLGTISGGDGHYTISWTGSNDYTASGISISGLTAGTYHYSVTDGIGSASVTGDVTVGEPAALTATVSSVNGTCDGTNSGAITLSNTTGVYGTYEYRLNDGTWQTDSSFGALVNGSYHIQMRDNANAACVKDLGNVTITKSGALPTVNITTGAPNFCSNFPLTANATGAATYSWSNGSQGPSINLGISDADGDYSVTVDNGNGCTAIATYSYIKQNQLNAYTIIGLKSVSIGRDNMVSGSIGNKKGQKITIGENTMINGFVKGVVVNAPESASISDGIINAPADVTLPAMMRNNSNSAALPNLTIPNDYSGDAITGNYNQLTIGKRAYVVITGNVYGKIIIKEAANVVFTAPDIRIDDIQTEDGKNNGSYTNVTFQQNTNIRIKNTIAFGNKNRLDAAGSTFYMGDANPDAEKVTIGGKNTVFNANIYMPDGQMNINGSAAANPCTMTGMFIAGKIVSDKYVYWTGYNCYLADQVANAAGRVMKGQAETETATQQSKEVAIFSREVKAGVYPNPSRGQFTLQLNNAKATKAEVMIVNQNGAQVMHQSAMSIEAGQALQFNLTNRAAGLYMVKVITSEGVQIFKLIISK